MTGGRGHGGSRHRDGDRDRVRRLFTGSGSTTTTIAPSLAAGFKQTQLAHGMTKPIVLAFVPGSGDVWIGEQGGTILDYHNGALSAHAGGDAAERLQPGRVRPARPRVRPELRDQRLRLRLLRVISTTNSSGTVVPAFAGCPGSPPRAAPSTRPPRRSFYQGNQVQNLHHAGNDLQIGPDGKLWWSTGDNVPAISNGEALNNIYGKMLRFNLDGSVPGGQPVRERAERGARHLRLRPAQPVPVHLPADRTADGGEHGLKLLGGPGHDPVRRQLRLGLLRGQLRQLRIPQPGLRLRPLPGGRRRVRDRGLHGQHVPGRVRPRGLLRRLQPR